VLLEKRRPGHDQRLKTNKNQTPNNGLQVGTEILKEKYVSSRGDFSPLRGGGVPFVYNDEKERGVSRCSASSGVLGVR